MTRRDLSWRLLGLVLFGAGCGTSLLHRTVLRAHAAGAATGLEAALGLASFAFACFGVALVIHGVRLRDEWTREQCRQARRRDRPLHRTPGHPCTDGAMWPGAFDAGREGMAAMLVERALLRHATCPVRARMPDSGGMPGARHQQGRY